MAQRKAAYGPTAANLPANARDDTRSWCRNTAELRVFFRTIARACAHASWGLSSHLLESSDDGWTKKQRPVACVRRLHGEWRRLRRHRQNDRGDEGFPRPCRPGRFSAPEGRHGGGKALAAAPRTAALRRQNSQRSPLPAGSTRKWPLFQPWRLVYGTENKARQGSHCQGTETALDSLPGNEKLKEAHIRLAHCFLCVFPLASICGATKLPNDLG